MSGMKPFYKARTQGMVILWITAGKMCDPEDHPALPKDDYLWPFLQRCWSPTPEERPTAIEVVKEVRNAEFASCPDETVADKPWAFSIKVGSSY